MKRIAVLLLAAALMLSAAGCGREKSASVQFFSMDTIMEITVYGKGAQKAADAARAEIESLDAMFSVSGTGSDIRKVNESGGGAVSEECALLVSRALELGADTGGAFDITLLPVIDAWGFHTDDPAVPDPAALADAMTRTGIGAVTVSGDMITFAKDGMGIDMGAVAKGYAAGKAAETLKKAGITSALITLGGNVRTVGAKPDGSRWRVAVQSPFDGDDYICVVSVEDCAVVTSGGYQRYFEQDGNTYHHIIDPETGYPADSGVVSATIVCGDDALADAFSTAVYVMGAERAQRLWREYDRSFDMIIVLRDGSVLVTEGIMPFVEAPGVAVTEIKR